MKKTSKLLVLSLLALTLVSCGNKTTTDSSNKTNSSVEWNDKSTIEVGELTASLEVGATYQINAKGSGSLSYASMDEEIATVDSNGLVSGVAEGDVVIKISNDNDYVYVRIHVGQAAGVKIDGTLSVYLSSNKLTLYIGENYTIKPKAMVSGQELTNAKFTYESSNPAVASVNDGTIVALSSGTTIIKVTANSDGNIATGQVSLTVNENITYLVPDFETREVVTGSPIDLSVALIQNSAMITTGVSDPVYSVSNDEVAFVKDNQLFAIRKGTITLTASVEFGGNNYSCDVDITARELYKVTYSMNSELLHEEYVKSGDCISYTGTPSKIDCVFKAWSNGEKLIYADTPIDYPMNLEPKWLVYSDDISSEDKILLWDYSTGNEIVCNNNAGAYLWEDYQYPDCRINVQMTNKTLLLTDIIFPKFEYSLFPAISFYFYNQFYNSQFVFGGYTSNMIEYKARNQVSIVGNKLFYNGVDTGQTVSEGVLNASESLKIQIKAATNSGGKMCVSGFYCHLSDE